MHLVALLVESCEVTAELRPVARPAVWPRFILVISQTECFFLVGFLGVLGCTSGSEPAAEGLFFAALDGELLFLREREELVEMGEEGVDELWGKVEALEVDKADVFEGLEQLVFLLGCDHRVGGDDARVVDDGEDWSRHYECWIMLTWKMIYMIETIVTLVAFRLL